MQACVDPRLQLFMELLTGLQKKFVDAVNGKSGLTYFDAHESEVGRLQMLCLQNTNQITEQKHNRNRERLSGSASRSNTTKSAVLDYFSGRRSW